MYSGVQPTPGYSFGERASGMSYLLEVYAIDGDQPLCLLGGFNITGPF